MNATPLPSSWAEWLTLERLEERFGARLIAAWLGESSLDYAVAPWLTGGGKVVVARMTKDVPHHVAWFARHGRSREHEPRLALHREGLALGCTCETVEWRGVCVHLGRLLVDLAAHPPLAQAVFSGHDARALVGELPDARAAALAERTALERFAQWMGPRQIQPIELAIEPTLDESEAALLVRVRRLGERRVLSLQEIATTTLAPADRRLLDLAEAPLRQRKALLARGPLAAMLLRELSPRGWAWSGTFRRQARFAAEPVRPRVVTETRTVTRVVGVGTRPATAAGRRVEVLACEWTSDAPGTVIQAEDALLFRGPSAYLWHRPTDTFHPVAADVDLDAAARLQRTPVVELPDAHRARIGRMLHASMRGCGIALPAREALGLAPVETPAFVLRVSGSPLELTARLEAAYGARTVVLPADVPAESDERDLDAEAAALAAVKRSGLDVRVDPESGEPRLCAEQDAAIDFWQAGIVELRASAAPRIEVLLSEKLARVRVGAPLRARVRVALEGGWLDARVDFASDELAVEMAEVRAALARGARWVTLSDGTLARIHEGVASLAGDAAELLGEDAAGRVRAHQLGRLTRWVDEHGGMVDAAVDAFRARLRALAVGAEPKMPAALTATLRPYQRQGLAWLQFLEELGAGGILADDMGLGKTLMTLALLAHQKETRGAAPSLVVCPTSVAPGWVREAERFTPGLRVLLYHGAARDAEAIASSDLVVTTYALLRRDIDALERVEFRTVVADEAQNIKNADAATTLAAKRLRAEMRLALSGTPVENRLRELWSILDFVNPGMLATARAFESRFERPIVAQPAGPAAAELRAIVRPFLLRRTKEEVLVELPPKTEIERACVLSAAQKRLYDALALTLRESVEQAIAEVGLARAGLNVLTALLRLRQMACDPRLVDPASRAPSAKRAAFLELVRELVAEGRRALVFSQFVELLRLWRADLDAEGIGYEYLDGTTADRASVVDRFQRGRAPLFLISLKAGGSGLNLTAADTVVHCDPWWNPAVEDQATDRAHRMGQQRPVTVVRLVAKGTVEEKIATLKATKRELAEAIVGGGQGALQGLSEQDIRGLLGDSEGEASEEGETERTPAPPRASDRASAGGDDTEEARRIAREWLGVPGRTQSQLGALVGMSQSAVSRLVRGEAVGLRPEVVQRIRAVGEGGGAGDSG